MNAAEYRRAVVKIALDTYNVFTSEDDRFDERIAYINEAVNDLALTEDFNTPQMEIDVDYEVFLLGDAEEPVS